jgi:histidinol dehydrogenase
VGDFLKLTSVVALEEEERKRLSRRAAVIARAEGLTAHARAMEED